MRNLYNAVLLTEEQKIAYIRVLSYVAKIDKNPSYIENEFTLKLLDRMQINPEVLKTVYVPRSNEELYKALMPICTRPIAIDLLHCLWFAASVDTVISDEEIALLRKIAQIVRIDNDTLLNIFHFVNDEIAFLQHAKEVLEAEEVRC